MKPPDENRDSTDSPQPDGDGGREPLGQEGAPDSPAVSDSATIRTFLRHAAAIIAADRGLTDQGRKKLEALALRLGMSETQQREAFAQLQLGSSELDDSLSHWERAFVALIKKQFSEIKHGILTVSIETRAIELAKRKYQINEIRAQQLVGHVVEELGMGRIEQTDAQQFGVRLISDLVGRQTELDDDFRRRLFREGKKWGLDKDRIEQVIAETIRESRRGRGRGRKSSRVPLIVAGSLLLALATAIFFQLSHRPKSPESGDNPSPIVAENKGGDTPPIQPTFADWWDDDLKTMYRTLETQTPDDAERLLALARQPEAKRTAVANELDFSSGDPGIGVRRDLLAAWFLRDPSAAVAGAMAEHFRNELERALTLRPVTRESIHRCQTLHRWVERVAGAADKAAFGAESMDASASDGLRIQRVQDLLRSVAEVYGQQASVDLLSQLNRLALTRFWTAALEDALDRPLSAAYLVGVLIDESTGLMPESEIQALADEVVGLILETEPSDHRILRPVISRLIEQANDSQLQRWSQRLRMLQHSEAAEFVASCLARRAGIPREFGPPDDVARELDRLHYHSRPGPAAGWLQHNAELDSLMVKIRNLVPESRSRSPQQIAYIVHGVQANLRLIAAFHEQDGAGGEPAEQLPLLTNFQIHESAEEQSFPAPSPSQLRELERMIERLKNSRNDQLATRESALKRLAVLADAVEDVTMEQATSLAAWVLEEGHAESEALVLEQVMPQLSHWPRLIMAIADRLESADVPLDTALTLFNRITEQTFEMPRDADWKSVMQQELLKYAAARIHRRSLAPDTSEQRDWNRLQKYVLQTRDPRQWLVERIELASENGGPSFSKQRSRQRVPFSAIAQDNQRWRFVLVESERVDSMQQWTMQSRVLFEWVEQKIERLVGPGDERVRNLKRRFQDEALSCSNMGELLGQTEWHLLEALNLWRNVLIEQAGSERGADGS